MRSLIIIILVLSLTFPALAATDWETLEPGLEYAQIPLAPQSSKAGKAHILRINPEQWRFRLLSKKEQQLVLRSDQWAERFNLTAVINAGMYQQDFISNVGYMRSKDTNNNRHVNAYKSAFAFDAKDGKTAPRIVDLDVTPFKLVSQKYDGIVQNLRLIKHPGENRWSKQPKKWSEAALAQDNKGRILFIFMRTPMNMYDFNEALLESRLNIVRAQHLEGGVEASLSIRHPKLQLHLFGKYEGSFQQNSGWPLPNVLGIQRK